jgi:peptidoglycan/LPS O-acetylase OafA/YrhL
MPGRVRKTLPSLLQYNGLMSHTSDIRPLTSLRWIAALLVFFSHYSGIPYRNGAGVWESIFLEGHAGVTIFFVLSGFLITLNYFPDVQTRTFSTTTFYLKRIARILPLYWFMLALVFVSSALLNRGIYAPIPLANWTLTQGYFSGAATSIMITGWSLTVEAAFYLIAPLILLSVARFGRTIRSAGITLLLWSVGLFLVGMALVALSLTSGWGQFHGFMSDFGFMTCFTLFGRGFHFCIGIFLGLVYLRQGDQLWSSPDSAGKATLLFIFGLLGIFGLQTVINASGGVLVAWYWNMGIAALAGLLILSLTCPTAVPARVLSGRLFVFLGQASYALYLFQATPVAHVLYAPFAQAPILFYGLMNLLSAGFYALIERPARKMVLGAGKRKC